MVTSYLFSTGVTRVVAACQHDCSAHNHHYLEYQHHSGKGDGIENKKKNGSSATSARCGRRSLAFRLDGPIYGDGTGGSAIRRS